MKRGGMTISAPECQQATHICVGGGKEIVTKEWLRQCCERGMIYAQNKVSYYFSTFWPSNLSVFLWN